ncbi:MAG: TolC family outer membrane protein [Hyphomicrobiales bacterium]|jgi:outer membrane protein|nr:TolC family outer membrane protein [Hyphomicrobiales bacterium]
MISSRPLLTSVAILALALSMGSVKAETIESALARAYANNADLNAQRASVRATDEQVPRAKSGYLPRVTAAAQGGRNNNVYNGSEANLTPRGLSLTVTQNLYNGDRTANQINAAEAGVLAAQAGLRQTEQSILLNAATQYMNVVRDEAVVRLRTANIGVLKEQLRQTQDRFQVGEVTRTDVAQVEAQLAAAEAEFSTAETNLAVSRAAYGQVVGAEPVDLADAEPVSKGLPGSLKEALAAGESSHPQVQAARHAVEVAEASVKAAEGELKPSVDLQGSVSRNWDYKAANDDVSDAKLLGVLSVPLYEAGEVSARVRAAKETLGQRQLEADSARFAVRSAIAGAWSQYETANARLKSAKAQIAAAEIALNGVREEAKVGQRTTLDVLISSQNLLGAQVNLVSAQHDRVVASYQVLASVGRLSAARLGLKVASYDPKKHYDASKSRATGTDLSAY